MKPYRFILEPYKGMATRHICPKCKNRSRTFVRYIDTETGKYIHADVGRCNRESKCGYHYTPKEYFQDNKGATTAFQYDGLACNRFNTPNLKFMPVSYISADEFKKSLTMPGANNFIEYLKGLFGERVTARLMGAKADAETEDFQPYFIGTSNHWDGATIFWQIDTVGRVRTGKIMQYNPSTGKRVKQPYNHINWVHKVPDRADFNLKQCLFGEHLLSAQADKEKVVCIVESEKTAIIASVYMPCCIWLACGSLSNLTAERCRVLKGWTVDLFPDLGGYEKWTAKAKELSHITKFVVSDMIEAIATDQEREDGLDLADYLIRPGFMELNIPT